LKERDEEKEGGKEVGSARDIERERGEEVRQPARSEAKPQDGWREFIAGSGRLYYHHKATKTTQWKKPPGWTG
jgi:hypothetical protein